MNTKKIKDLLIQTPIYSWLKSLQNSLKISQEYLRIYINLVVNYLYDFNRVRRFSGVNNQKSRDILKAKITMNYHRIEKGLSLSNTRVGFGAWAISQLIPDLDYYIKNYSPDQTTEIAINALNEYINFNKSHNLTDSKLEETIKKLGIDQQNYDNRHNQGGTKEITSAEIYNFSKLDLSKFFQNRYSIRNFSDEPVDLDLIEQAILMAQKTPSVCNRQSCRVYVFTEKEDKLKVLAHQNGNRGFTEQIDKVLVVTSQLPYFLTVGERNQCWIDGGMFAMSLIYALHSLGLGTCCLNWSVEKQQDLALKKTANIPESDSIIMLIGVGNLPKILKVAQSPRRDISEVMQVKKL